MQLALQYTIALAIEVNGVHAIKECLALGLDITIVGDNDFYSQRAAVRDSYFRNWDLLYDPPPPCSWNHCICHGQSRR